MACVDAPLAADQNSEQAGHPARKRRHIEVCLTEPVGYTTRTTGFEKYDLPYNAVPDSDLDAVDLSTRLLGKPLAAPVLIGAMTGGAQLSGRINENLAAAAQQLGLGMMLGSQRVMLARPETAASFTVRPVAPDVLLIGNLGLVQLNYGFGPEQVTELVESVGADALALHSNPLQEAMQEGGDTNFAALSDKLAGLTAAVRYPLLLKEVGHGIGGATAARLAGSGLAAIDVAGAGGTSWSRVEQFARYGRIEFPELAEWGIPTATALRQVRAALPGLPVIASGGIRTGTDAAKALVLGASAVAIAAPLLAPAIESAEAVVSWLTGFLAELRIGMHCMGVADIAGLSSATLLDR